MPEAPSCYAAYYSNRHEYTTMNGVFEDKELEELVFNTLTRGRATSIGLCEEGGLQFYIVAEEGEYTADSPQELKGTLKAFRKMDDTRYSKTPTPSAGDRIPAEELEKRMKEPNKETAISDYENPLHEALRITIEEYGEHYEIWLGPLMRELRPLQHLERERTGGNVVAEEWIERFEAHDIGRVEERMGKERKYSVLLLNEKHDLVSEIREEAGIWPRIA